MHRAVRAKVAARVAAALVLVLTFGGLLGGGYVARAGVPAQTTVTQQPASKVSPEVMQATANGHVAPITILLSDQADLSAAYSITDRVARGRYVYNTLKAHADKTQAGVKAELAAAGVPYTSYWVANVVFAQGDRALVEKLAARSDVKLVDSNAGRHVIDDPAPPAKAPLAPETVEWNITRVNAPQVWDLGYRGEGIVVGINDTGVKWDHEALKPHYRGWNGATADHNYNWHDSIDVDSNVNCPGNSPAPCDGYNHGTHVAGIAVGDNGGANQIGVAPGAKWIACRSMNTAGDGTPQTYTECFQFFLAPTDLNGQNENPDLRPHIINNSWGCTPGEGCTSGNLQVLEPIVNDVQAAGIFVVSSAGNSGPNCGTVSQPPAIYPATFATGALDSSNSVASFSSRGPVTVDGSNRLKPNISAPGVSIRSSVNSGGYSQFQGTSMASPHVAGTVALLWNVWPDLQGNITDTKTLLQNTANTGVTVPNNQTCGGTPPTQIPNNMFGYGLVDAYAAVLGHCGNGPITQEVRTAEQLSPNSITVSVGSTVRWTSQSGTHTSTSNTDLWDSGTLPAGQSFSYTFTSPGTYKYHCELHPGMTGTINVVNGCPNAATPTSTPTETNTATSTPTSTETSTATSTDTSTNTATGTSTSTSTPTKTDTPTYTSTSTATGTPTKTATATQTPAPCATTVDVSLGGAQSRSNGPSGVCPATPSPTASPSPSPSPSPSATPLTGSSITPSATLSPTATSTSCPIQFADVPSAGEGSTFYSFVRCLACRHIVGGYPCGGPGEECNGSNDPYFRPGTNVTRGQISKMVALSANLSGPTGSPIFEDVAPGSTFYDPIQQLASRGYVGGYPCGDAIGEPCKGPANRPYFRPSTNATRGQLSKIVSETAQFNDDPGPQIFTDVPEDSTFFTWINRLANRNVISGYPCGSTGEPCDDQNRPYFRPGDDVTRGQTAKIVANTFYPNCQTPAKP